ncbi:hypothetical protein B0H14DRAFT_3485117 [Mycena olivaceomarginata]|nr:hypothetical protein B0H14DRAFT_3485117 [Mycena olivaceomarginata]
MPCQRASFLPSSIIVPMSLPLVVPPRPSTLHASAVHTRIYLKSRSRPGRPTPLASPPSSLARCSSAPCRLTLTPPIIIAYYSPSFDLARFIVPCLPQVLCSHATHRHPPRPSIFRTSSSPAQRKLMLKHEPNDSRPPKRPRLIISIPAHTHQDSTACTLFTPALTSTSPPTSSRELPPIIDLISHRF